MVERKERMVDKGLEEAELTFDLGEPATEQEIKDGLNFLERLEKESDEQR